MNQKIYLVCPLKLDAGEWYLLVSHTPNWFATGFMISCSKILELSLVKLGKLENEMASENDRLQATIEQYVMHPPRPRVVAYVDKFRERERRGDSISGQVKGNHGYYRVTVGLENGRLSSVCSCFIGKHGGCHHCTALEMTFLNNPDSFRLIGTTTRAAVKDLAALEAYLEGVTLDELTQQLKKHKITQKAVGEAIGMSSQMISSLKRSEKRNYRPNELGATKLACLWVLENLV